MNFFKTWFWKKIRSNKKLYGFIHNTAGVLLKNYQLRDRIKAMKVDGLRTIFEIDNLLGNEKCLCFVNFGTLLGFVRNGQPLPWDFDVDFGVEINDSFHWKDLQDCVCRIGFRLERQFTFKGVITEQTYGRNGVSVDFFNTFSDAKNSFYYVYYRKNDFEYENRQHLHARLTKTIHVQETIPFNVEGGIVHVPKDYEQYLEDVYGKDWRIPNPHWEVIPMPNIVYLDELGEVEEFTTKDTPQLNN